MPAQRESEPLPKAGTPRESIGELLSKLANHSAGLIRDELMLAKQELREKLSALQSGLIIMVMGAVMGVVALMALCAAAVLGLAAYVGAWQSALLIGALLALSAGVTAWVGLRRLQRRSLKPAQTIQT
ncbi:MAG: phage holin family protein [Chloroflexi bacterium]|nr:phage holin family protein [Chloroflexota bacterium]